MGKDHWGDIESARAHIDRLRALAELRSRCGILTHDNHETAADGAVRGLDLPEQEVNRLFQLSQINPSAAKRALKALNWRGDVTWTDGGTAIIEGEKPDLED